MKRQVAITGPTPEFLRWSVRQSCPLRDSLEPGSIDATEKQLRAVRVAGLAISREQVYDGVAARYVDRSPRGFRLSEVFQVFGGVQEVTRQCSSCVANVLADPLRHGHLAGCHGWLKRQDNGDSSIDLGDLLEQVINDRHQSALSRHFLETTPVWYGLWAGRVLARDHLILIDDLLERMLERLDGHDDVRDFQAVAQACIRHRLLLDVELVPPGFSDGLRWTIQTHCDHCKAAFGDDQQGCRCCKRAGRGHPEIHRKVRGLRPWVDLATVIGVDELNEFLSRHDLQGRRATDQNTSG